MFYFDPHGFVMGNRKETSMIFMIFPLIRLRVLILLLKIHEYMNIMKYSTNTFFICNYIFFNLKKIKGFVLLLNFFLMKF